MRPSSQTPTINTGSMADIAFLLLIFFLVTTTLDKPVGIPRQLPTPCPTGDCYADVLERNLFSIQLNDAGELLVNNGPVGFENLRELLTSFIDNNGDKSCHYCFGDNLNNSSDNPDKAVILLNTSRKTPYKTYIKVQNEINLVYFDLRERYAKRIFNKELGSLSSREHQTVRDAYPMLLSEATLARN